MKYIILFVTLLLAGCAAQPKTCSWENLDGTWVVGPCDVIAKKVIEEGAYCIKHEE